MEPCKSWRLVLHIQGGGRWQPSASREGNQDAAGAVGGYSRRSVAATVWEGVATPPKPPGAVYIPAETARTRRRASMLLKLFLQNFCIYHILHFASHSPLFLHLSFLRKFRWTSTLSILFSFTIFPLFSPISFHFFSFRFQSSIDSLSPVRFFAHFTTSPPLFFYRRISR